MPGQCGSARRRLPFGRGGRVCRGARIRRGTLAARVSGDLPAAATKEPTIGALDRAPLIHPEDRAAWRRWLDANHAAATGVWVVGWRRASGRSPVPYEDLIEEALCFGWIDGQGARIDEERAKLYLAPRKAGSVWARSNKDRVERLIGRGAMTPAGLAVIERAKADGSWALLDPVDRLEVPDDLATALDARPGARANWDAFPRSARHQLLGWIAIARRADTRARRVAATAAAAERNERTVRP